MTLVKSAPKKSFSQKTILPIHLRNDKKIDGYRYHCTRIEGIFQQNKVAQKYTINLL